LARDLRNSELDLLVSVSTQPPFDARHSRAFEVVWVRAPGTRLDFSRPVSLVSHGETSVFQQLAVTALNLAELRWENVFTGASTVSLDAAVAAGLGIMAMTAQRAASSGFTVCDDASLPKLPDIYSGIFIREGGARAAYEQLADDIAAAIYSPAGRPDIKTVSAA
jgi:DNA-binding transcriptional LysR family regulator